MLFSSLGVEVLAGLPLGAIFGILVARAIGPAFGNENLRFDIPVHPRTFAIASAFIVLSAAASALAVNRRIGRLDLVAVLKTRE